MTPDSLVSVLIAAYNAERWLGETLDSVLAQTHPNLEIIVVDDGSTDGTLGLARRYQDRGVRVIHQSNAGAPVARNRAFAASNGELIQFLDADDLLAPRKLEHQVSRLAREPNGTIASCSWSRFYDNDLRTASQTDAPDWHDFDPASDWTVAAWQKGAMMPSHAWLTPRGCIERAGPWNETLLRNQDGEFFTRVLVNARKVAFCANAWVYYRSGIDGSISKRYGKEALRSLYDATVLCERALLSHRTDSQAQQAVSGLYQEFLFTAYPDVPHLVNRAEARINELGGLYKRPGMIRPLRPVRDILGWKAARRAARIYRRSGLERLVQWGKAPYRSRRSTGS